MADTIVFNTTDTTFTIIKNGVTAGTWTKPEEVDNEWEFDIQDTELRFSLAAPYYGEVVNPNFTVTVDSVDKSALTMRQLYAFLKDEVFFLPAAGGGISHTPVDYEITIVDQTVTINGVAFVNKPATIRINGSVANQVWVSIDSYHYEMYTNDAFDINGDPYTPASVQDLKDTLTGLLTVSTGSRFGASGEDATAMEDRNVDMNQKAFILGNAKYASVSADGLDGSYAGFGGRIEDDDQPLQAEMYCGDGVTETRLKATPRAINATGLTTHANNADAIAADLIAGDLYYRTGHGLDIVT